MREFKWHTQSSFTFNEREREKKLLPAVLTINFSVLMCVIHTYTHTHTVTQTNKQTNKHIDEYELNAHTHRVKETDRGREKVRQGDRHTQSESENKTELHVHKTSLLAQFISLQFGSVQCVDVFISFIFILF